MSRFRDDEMVSGKLVNRQDVLIDDLERQLAEARGLIANVKADLISIQDTTSDPITSLQLGACIKKVKE